MVQSRGLATTALFFFPISSISKTPTGHLDTNSSAIPPVNSCSQSIKGGAKGDDDDDDD